MLFIGLTCVLALYVACNLGANDVANSMGTSVGSKAVTLRQALWIAGILEFLGAVLFGHRVSKTLAGAIVEPNLFSDRPHLFILGMVAVSLACGIWLQIATSLGLPVSSSHAVVGAIAGFGWVAFGSQAVHWQTIGVISITWVLTPVFSGAIAALFYSLIRRWILDQPNPIQQLYEWTPWLSAILVSVFGFIILPSLSITNWTSKLSIPDHDIFLILGAIAILTLTLTTFNSLPTSPFSPSPPTSPESLLARFQLLSACFVAFAHGSNDVGNAIAPLGAIVYIHQTGQMPGSDLAIAPWVFVLGGVGIVTGLAIWGKNVITTVGEGITALQPSGGFCAELATATTTLLASSVGLPVSTSHALVGAVVGIGLVHSWRSGSKNLVQFGTLRSIGLAWLVTIPVATVLAIALFTILRSINF